MASQDFERFDISTGEIGAGDLFIGPDGHQANLASFNVLWSGVDTIRQLYQGRLKMSLLADIATAYEGAFGATIELNGLQWVVMSGRRGGFRYLLQNRDYGLTLLVQSYYGEADSVGTHLKIEASPRWIYERSSQQINDEMAFWGRLFLDALEPSGVALHLAVDFQGWVPPHDFAQRFVTRAKTVSVHNGVSTVDWETGSVVNGQAETFTFGKANSLQVCLYDKSKEVDVSDKRAFMESIWQCATNEECFPDSCYDPEKPVWRLEIRLHHRIVNEISDGTEGMPPLKTYLAAVPHLTGLWRYALNANRYECKRNWVHPVWTKLRQDIGFGYDAPDLLYKRAKKQPGCGNEKNVTLAFGNLLSVYARNHFNSRQAWDCLKKSGLWDDLIGYYRRRDISENDLFKVVEESLIKRRLLGKVCA